MTTEREGASKGMEDVIKSSCSLNNSQVSNYSISTWSEIKVKDFKTFPRMGHAASVAPSTKEVFFFGGYAHGSTKKDLNVFNCRNIFLLQYDSHIKFPEQYLAVALLTQKNPIPDPKIELRQLLLEISSLVIVLPPAF